MLKHTWICSRCLRALRHQRQHADILKRSQSSTSQSAHTSKFHNPPDEIYPALLSRARDLTTKHNELSQKLSNSYDASIAKKAGELASIANALKTWEKATDSLHELRSLIDDPSTDDELRTLASQDLEVTTEELRAAGKSLTTSLIPKHPFADMPCLLEIRPGVGGGEAAIFAKNLLDMYTAYFAREGLQATFLKLDDGGSEGRSLSEAVLEIANPGAYGRLRCEAGVHRVQRIPATEAKGRVHTSTASVMVLPSYGNEKSSGADDAMDENDPNSDFYVDVKDVRRDFMRASGPGGQHVNKTESAVRLTHEPTGTVVSIQDSRYRYRNEERAWALLRGRLAQARREAREEEIVRLRRSVIGVARVGRADKVRTYNFGQQRVTDHRSGITVYGLDGIMTGGGNLEKIMESVRGWMVENEIEDMILGAKEADKQEKSGERKGKSKVT